MGNINDNRGHVDAIAEGTPIPPGGKRPKLDPNRAPGMTLDHKDSFCGKLLHYMVGGSHPTNMSGTHVPGIRMDGATEGEYPKGMFSQNKRAVKAFVNCFAGYFHTMGGSIPPCPGDCPPKSLHLNNNSNRANPLKKTAYEYPWSIRAGFLPENIEAFELMEEASTSKNGNKTSTKPKKSFGNNGLDSLPKPITPAVALANKEAELEAEKKKEAEDEEEIKEGLQREEALEGEVEEKDAEIERLKAEAEAALSAAEEKDVEDVWIERNRTKVLLMELLALMEKQKKRGEAKVAEDAEILVEEKRTAKVIIGELTTQVEALELKLKTAESESAVLAKELELEKSSKLEEEKASEVALETEAEMRIHDAKVMGNMLGIAETRLAEK